MATTTLPGRPASSADPSPHATTPAGPGRFRRLLRGRTTDPAWVRPALLGLLVATALLYLVDLSSSGYANSFYSAAVQAGTKSWKAFFFGSSDAANFITVDKPPASLWMMEIPARIFGVNAWTLLAPQALEGVAAVGLLYLTMRRAFSAGVGILAGAVLALTPVATLMFRFNNPDALLVLVLVAAAYATVRAVEQGRTRWLVAAGVLVGFGFITKELQALVVVPPLALVYLVAGPPRLRRRILQLLAAGAALVVSAGWWVAAVQLTPAADRPYIGGSQNNSLLNVIFGYNGFGRLTGAESGSVGGAGRGGPGAGGSMWGPTGLLRMFNSEFGTQIAWLLPAALAAIVVGLWVTRRTRRTNPIRAAFLLWGTWLLVTGLVFSLGQGIIHPYYSVALAPAIAALVAGCAGLLWARRDHWVARVILAAGVAGTVIWADVLLRRTPTWNAWLQATVLVAGLVAAVGLALGPILGRVSIAGRGVGQVVGRRTGMAVGALALIACLAGPGAYSVATAATAYSSAIPTAGPSSGGGFGGGPRFGGGAFRGARGAGGGLPRGGFAGGFGGGFGRGAGLAPPGAGAGVAGGGTGLPGAGAGVAGGGAGVAGGWRRTRRGRRRRGHASLRRPLRPLRRRGWAGGRRLRRWGAGRSPLGERPRQGLDRCPQRERFEVHLGGGRHRIRVRVGVPVGHREAGHGHRWLQRDRPLPGARPLPERCRPGQDPLLHRRRERRRWAGRTRGWRFLGLVSHQHVGRGALRVQDGRRGHPLRPDSAPRHLTRDRFRPAVAGRLRAGCSRGLLPSIG